MSTIYLCYVFKYAVETRCKVNAELTLKQKSQSLLQLAVEGRSPPLTNIAQRRDLTDVTRSHLVDWHTQ